MSTIFLPFPNTIWLDCQTSIDKYIDKSASPDHMRMHTRNMKQLLNIAHLNDDAKATWCNESEYNCWSLTFIGDYTHQYFINIEAPIVRERTIYHVNAKTGNMKHNHICVSNNTVVTKQGCFCIWEVSAIQIDMSLIQLGDYTKRLWSWMNNHWKMDILACVSIE